MPAAPSAPRLLFVDDEASIRMTLPPVLERAGFEVRIAESVSDALFEINSRQFEILISDLNIGEEGDGFLVTSAMRHVQPDCLTFILTGYPAFETALQAIHNHVDDYLVKPVDIQSLTKTLNDKLHHRGPRLVFGAKRLSSVLKADAGQIISRTMAAQQNGKKGPNSEAELKQFLSALIEQLELGHDQPNPNALPSAPAHGKKQVEGQDPTRLATQFRCLEQEAYHAVQDHLASMDLATLIGDLRRFSAGVHSLLEESLEGMSRKSETGKKVTSTGSHRRKARRPTRQSR